VNPSQKRSFGWPCAASPVPTFCGRPCPPPRVSRPRRVASGCGERRCWAGFRSSPSRSRLPLWPHPAFRSMRRAIRRALTGAARPAAASLRECAPGLAEPGTNRSLTRGASRLRSVVLPRCPPS
jgi:hypothetical protein